MCLLLVCAPTLRIPHSPYCDGTWLAGIASAACPPSGAVLREAWCEPTLVFLERSFSQCRHVQIGVATNPLE
jgi:hypothetical protein